MLEKKHQKLFAISFSKNENKIKALVFFKWKEVTAFFLRKFHSNSSFVKVKETHSWHGTDGTARAM